jgi:hypothetical protein
MELLISDKSVFEINNRYPQKYKLHEGAEILIFDDFLAKPDEYRDLLDRMPAFNSDFFYKTASPGWRQIIPYEFYFHIEALMSNFTQYEVWVEQAFTNIYRSRMPCKSKCWLPHYDNKEYAFNLWLCDGPGGTGFYNWNGVCNVNHFIEDVRQKVFQHHEKGEYLYMKSLLVMKTGNSIIYHQCNTIEQSFTVVTTSILHTFQTILIWKTGDIL